MTPSGITISVRLVQLLKASFPMEVTWLGMVQLCRLVQWAKAKAPIWVTLSGMSTVSRA